jgi:hypothetical protein
MTCAEILGKIIFLKKLQMGRRRKRTTAEKLSGFLSTMLILVVSAVLFVFLVQQERRLR